MKIRFGIIDIVDSYAFLGPYGKTIDLGTDQRRDYPNQKPSSSTFMPEDKLMLVPPASIVTNALVLARTNPSRSYPSPDPVRFKN
jgi:hypothetical protein